jgi:hypothetical protein
MSEIRNRDKVVAEITLFHLMRLAQEHGCTVTQEEALALLNHEERAQCMWNRMMEAGLDFIAHSLFPQ